MKPIEIYIEGYKIVITEDKEPEVIKENEADKIICAPCQLDSDWRRNPLITWKGPGDVILTNTTDCKAKFTPVRDAMTGRNKEAKDGEKNE